MHIGHRAQAMSYAITLYKNDTSFEFVHASENNPAVRAPAEFSPGPSGAVNAMRERTVRKLGLDSR